MLTMKTLALILGVVLCCLGIKCLPVGFAANPERNLSLFSNFADTGAFAHTGVVLICAGLLVIALTLLFPCLARAFHRLTTRQPKKKSY
jgi:hypothetical protein